VADPAPDPTQTFAIIVDLAARVPGASECDRYPDEINAKIIQNKHKKIETKMPFTISG
jgi:hypothetical protein